MSAVPVFSPDQATRARVVGPRALPASHSRRLDDSGRVAGPRVRAHQRTRPSAWPIGAVAFFLMTAVTYGASTLLGQSVMEHARVEAGRAEVRARFAREETTRLQRRLDLLTAPQAVSSWAALRGFVPVHRVFSPGEDGRDDP